MKILHIAAHLGGGAGKAISGIVSHQSADNDVRLLLLEEPIDTKYLVGLKDKVVIICDRSLQTLINEITWADIVIINWWCHPLMVELLSDFPPILCRVIIWCHINGCSYPFMPFDFLNKFEKVIFTSEFSFENRLWKRSEKHQIWSKSALVYGMGNYQPFNIKPKTEYDRNKDFVVGYIGTVNYGKLANDFIEYCTAAFKVNPNVRFVVVGEPDPIVVNDVKNSGLSEKIYFAGQVIDTEKYFISFDVLGYLLNEDSFATTENVLLEAMAYGLPIIVKSNNVEQRIIHDGVNGYVVNNADEYAEELLYLYDHPEECRFIGKKAREYCIKTYKQYENKQLFDEVILKVLDADKKEYGFHDFLGNQPIDWFLYFTADDKAIFHDYIMDQSEENRKRLIECKPIYKEKTKSSIFHYLSYFPEDKYIKMISEVLSER